MQDLQNTSGPTPGPATPTADAKELLPLPAAPISLPEIEDLASLSVEDIKGRLEARQRDMKYRIAAIKQEVVHVADDVNIGGRPLIDRVRERPLAALGLALTSGAMLGLLWGLRRRAKRMPDQDERTEVIHYHVAQMLEASARRVARGERADDAIHAEIGKRPVIFVPSEEDTKKKAPATSSRQAVDTALKTAVGIGVKTGMDLLTKRFTNHEEVFEAIADEA